MIRNFKSKVAQDIFDGTNSRWSRQLPLELHRKTQRFFDQINAATQLETLRIPPSNRLEKLKRDLKNYWSLRINNQWRIIFKWENNDALDIDIVDYH